MLSSMSVLVLGFVLGMRQATDAGLTLVTVAIAVPSSYAAARVGGAQRHVQLAAGVASVCVALLLAHRVGVMDGLFTADQHWTPE